MNLEFHKYQGAGNDFIMVDNRDLKFPSKNYELVKQLCDRRFGIGADGLILVQKSKQFDFEMLYYNADGFEGSMCGNGGRCAFAFAESLSLVKSKSVFLATDGPHEAFRNATEISLKMKDVSGVEKISKDYFLNTGSPHYVRFVDDVQKIDVVKEGRKIRYNARFKKEGTNVNFVEVGKNKLKVRTYERGVEDETLSCGTGVTAVALVANLKKVNPKSSQFLIETLGGKLRVSFENKAKEEYTSIWLTGPASFVYKGNYIY